MRMGLVSSTDRHTAFDASVVFHEFMHGVTNRLVGGPLNVRALEDPQSGGMGEGWGDYIACTINDTTVVGDWVVDNPDGIRGFPYDSDFPDSFGDLGTGRYDEEHNIGEIWCATLLEMNRKIGVRWPSTRRRRAKALACEPELPGHARRDPRGAQRSAVQRAAVAVGARRGPSRDLGGVCALRHGAGCAIRASVPQRDRRGLHASARARPPGD